MQAKDERNKIFWGKLRSDDEDKVCIVQAPEVMCKPGPWGKVNLLSNSRLEIDIPHFPSGKAKNLVMRIRYNISTTDFDPWKTDSSSNMNDDVIKNDPIEDLGTIKLELAVDTSETGRTFQDRSHVLTVLPRLDSMKGKRIHNLNVKGRRGNDVQTYPSVQYDFIPNKLTIKKSTDLVHVQWTGSNNNVNDEGEGKYPTDRNNMVVIESMGKS
jgi:hypothetical protein